MKGSKSGTASGIGKGKATTEEKGKWSQLCTKIGMDFDTKTISFTARRRLVSTWRSIVSV